MKTILTALLILGTALVAQARPVPVWSYQALYTQADLVVIAAPISTQDTPERADLPGIAPPLQVIGQSTSFDVSLVLKGDANLKKLTLHHYRLLDPAKLAANGPALASFDPKQQTRYLLFLRREPDGRYAPVSGQTDPALLSILKLSGMAQ